MKLYFSSSLLSKLLGLALVVLLISACSTRWVYNQLDWLVPWYLSDYVSIEDYQEPQFEVALDELIQWHRTTQLPQYALELESIKQNLNNGLTKEEYALYYQSFDTFIQAAFSKMGSQFSPLMASMNSAQKEELLTNLKTKSDEYAAENILIGEAESRAKREQKMQDFMEKVLGDLRPEQVVLIQQWAQNRPWMAPSFYNNRVAWQEKLTQLFATQELDPSELERLFQNRQQNWSPTFKAKMQKSRLASRELLIKIVNSLDDPQRQHVNDKIDDYLTDFRYLAQQDY